MFPWSLHLKKVCNQGPLMFLLIRFVVWSSHLNQTLIGAHYPDCLIILLIYSILFISPSEEVSLLLEERGNGHTFYFQLKRRQQSESFHRDLSKGPQNKESLVLDSMCKAIWTLGISHIRASQRSMVVVGR